MKLSTKGRYGLLALGHLAEAYGKKTVPISEMAEKDNLSVSYLEQIFADLKKSGIVEGVRGARGGYTLKNPPESTTLYSAFEALEGISLTCGSSREELPCLKGSACKHFCTTEKLLDKIQKEIYDTLQKYTLKDLI